MEEGRLGEWGLAEELIGARVRAGNGERPWPGGVWGDQQIAPPLSTSLYETFYNVISLTISISQFRPLVVVTIKHGSPNLLSYVVCCL